VFNPLLTSEKQPCNQSTQYQNYRKVSITKRKPSRATTESTLFGKDEWNTKEGTGKSMKNALYVLQYAKRHFSSQSNVKQ